MNNTVKNGINEVRLGDRLKLLDYVWEARKTFSLSQRADRIKFSCVSFLKERQMELVYFSFLQRSKRFSFILMFLRGIWNSCYSYFNER